WPKESEPPPQPDVYRHGNRPEMADDVAMMLHVVIERPIDEAELAARQGHRTQPVVVERVAEGRRKWQDEIEQFATEHRCGPGHGVREEQRSEVRGVVPPRCPVG